MLIEENAEPRAEDRKATVQLPLSRGPSRVSSRQENVLGRE